MNIHSFGLILIFLFSVSVDAQVVQLGQTEHPTQYAAGKILREIFNKVGHAVEIKTYPAARVTALGKTGEIDGEVARIGNYYQGKDHFRVVSQSYYGFNTAVFAHKQLKIKVQAVEDLKNYKVGAVKGILHSEMALEGVREKVFLNDVEHLYQALNTGRIDLAIDTDLAGAYYIKKFKFHDLEHVGNVANHEFYMGLNHKWDALSGKLALKIEELKKSGRLKKIIEKAEKEVLAEDFKSSSQRK